MSNNDISKPQPAMAVLSLGFVDYVLPVKQATEIVRCMEHAERYNTRYRSEDDGGSMHFVWQEPVSLNLRLLSNDEYVQGKFTGKYDPSAV